MTIREDVWETLVKLNTELKRPATLQEIVAVTRLKPVAVGTALRDLERLKWVRKSWNKKAWVLLR